MTGFAKGLGCLVAGLIVAIAGMPLLFAWAWGGAHCEPVPQCQRDGELHFIMLAIPLIGIAALAGFTVSQFTSRFAQKRADEGISLAFSGVAVLAAVAVVAAVVALVLAVLV